MHAPSRFSFDRSENLFPHGAWDVEVHEANQSSIRKNAIEKEREIRGDPLFSACALVRAMGCHRGYGESGKP